MAAKQFTSAAGMTCTGCGIGIRERKPGVRCHNGAAHDWAREGEAPSRAARKPRRADIDPETAERRARLAALKPSDSPPIRRDWPEDDPYHRRQYNSCAWGVHERVVRDINTGAEVCPDCRFTL